MDSNRVPRPVCLKELCYLLSVSRATVKGWVDKHGLPTVEVGHSPVRHYDLSQVMQWLEKTDRISYADRLK